VLTTIKVTCKLVVLALLLSGCNEYSPGKDTVKSYGDGSLQIVNISHNMRGNELVLYDLKIEESLVREVKKYREINGEIYIISSNGYSIVNIKTHEVVKKNKISDFIKAEQEIFEGMK